MHSGSPTVPRRVLAVDDDPISLAIAAVLLESEGCEVLQAESGEEALTLAASDPPDCIIADLRMPSLAGPELAQVLRRAAPEALLLAMSATPPPHVDGYDGVLRKPLSPEGLHAAFARRATLVDGDSADVDGDGAAFLDTDTFDRLRRAISPGGLQEIYSVFFTDTRQRIDAMRSADADEVRREAHTIKGGAGMIGALRISHLASAVESGIDDPGDRLRKLDQMEAHCRSTEIILKRRLQA